MQLLNRKLAASMAGGSFIRKMFEKGIELKKKFGEDAVCDFSLGNPDVPPPAAAGEVLAEIARQAVKPLGLGYCPNAGLPVFREAAAAMVSRQQNMAVPAGNIVATVGAAGAIVSFFRAVLEDGDEVIVPSPYFVEYGNYCGHFGGVLKPVSAKAPSFDLDVEAIAAAITDRTRAIIINSPNNPTGAIYPFESVKALADVIEKVNAARERPVFLLSDEPYRVFAFDGAVVPPILPLTKWALVLGSFSKSLSLAGERIGYIAPSPEMPEVDSMLAALTLANRTLGFVNAPVIGQRLAAALAETSVDLEIYARRRKLMAEVLVAAGIEFTMPRGAFYFFPKAPSGDDSVFTDALLKENILAVPGSGFGCPGHIRLSFSVDEKIIARSAEGFKRAAEVCRQGK